MFKGKKMAGHMGAARVTVQNLEVVKTDAERGLIMVKGAVPGSKGGWVTVQATRPRKPRAENVILPAALRSAAEEAKRAAEEAAAAKAAGRGSSPPEAPAEAEEAAIKAAEADAAPAAEGAEDAAPEGGEEK